MISAFFDWIDATVSATARAVGSALFNSAIFVATVAVMIALFGAPGAFFIRGAVYLYNGEWVYSACDTAHRIGYMKPGECSVATGFKGFDNIANYALSGVDLSVGLLIVAAFLGVTLLGLVFTAFIVAAAIRD